MKRGINPYLARMMPQVVRSALVCLPAIGLDISQEPYKGMIRCSVEPHEGSWAIRVLFLQMTDDMESEVDIILQHPNAIKFLGEHDCACGDTDLTSCCQHGGLEFLFRIRPVFMCIFDDNGITPEAEDLYWDETGMELELAVSIAQTEIERIRLWRRNRNSGIEGAFREIVKKITQDIDYSGAFDQEDYPDIDISDIDFDEDWS